MATVAFHCAPGTMVDRVIRLASGSIYSHVELLGDPQGDAWEVISASKRDGGRVRAKVIRLEPGHWHYLTLPAVDPLDAWRRAAQHLGQPYDTTGAAVSILAARIGAWRQTRRGGARYCSDLIGEAMGIPQAWSLTPGELFAAMQHHGALFHHDPRQRGQRTA